MKRILSLFTVFFISILTVNATTTTNETKSINTANYVSGYGNSFIFVEAGIEFSVFPDGQFDFYMQNYGPNVNVAVNTPGVSISFNSGFNYNPYVQYDEFGAIVQIENVPVYYDFYGRVRQVGAICINYNGFGYVSRVGGLYVHYNRFNRFAYCTGFINPFNRFYVYRPWHRYYRVPAYNHCVVYNRPYRQYYTPIRYAYTRPYTNNYRRTTAVASRRGTTVQRRRDLATRGYSDRGRRNQVASTRSNSRNQIATSNGRLLSNTRSTGRRTVERNSRSEENSQTITRGNSRNRNSNSTSLNQRKTELRTNNRTRTIKSNAVTRPQTRMASFKKNNNSRKVASVQKSSRSIDTRKNNSAYGKPKANNSRTYNKDKNRSSRSRSQGRTLR